MGYEASEEDDEQVVVTAQKVTDESNTIAQSSKRKLRSFRNVSHVRTKIKRKVNKGRRWKTYNTNTEDTGRQHIPHANYTQMDQLPKKRLTRKKTCDPLDYRVIHIRSSPVSLMMAVSCLNPRQRKAVKDLDFGNILNINIKEIPTRIGYWVLDHFDEKDCVLRAEKGVIPVTPQLVHSLLDIPMGLTPIVTGKIINSKDMITQDCRRQFGRAAGTFSLRAVLEIIQSDRSATRLFMLKFMVLFVSAIAECTKNGSINQLVLLLLTGDDEIKNLDWCSYVVDCLKSSKVEWDRNAETCSYAGPITVLKTLPVDKTKNILKCWDTKLLRDWELQEIVGGGFGRCKPEIDDRESKYSATRLRLQDEVGTDNEDEEDNGANEEGNNTDQYYLNVLDDAIIKGMETRSQLTNILKETLSKFPDDEALINRKATITYLFVRTDSRIYHSTKKPENQSSKEDVTAIADTTQTTFGATLTSLVTPQNEVNSELVINGQMNIKEEYDVFAKNIAEAVRHNPQLANLKEIDLVFFPFVLHDNAFICCFNLRDPAFHILDSKKGQRPMSSSLSEVHIILHNMFISYHYNVAHPKANKIASLTPARLETP